LNKSAVESVLIWNRLTYPPAANQYYQEAAQGARIGESVFFVVAAPFSFSIFYAVCRPFFSLMQAAWFAALIVA